MQGLITTWFGKQDESKIIMIDTPGIGDSKGKDTDHIANIVAQLKTIGFVHSFIIVINSAQKRMDEQT